MHGRQCPQVFHTACELPGRHSFLVQDRTAGLARCFNAQSRTEVLLCSLLMGAANSQKRFMQQPHFRLYQTNTLQLSGGRTVLNACPSEEHFLPLMISVTSVALKFLTTTESGSEEKLIASIALFDSDTIYAR